MFVKISYSAFSAENSVIAMKGRALRLIPHQYSCVDKDNEVMQVFVKMLWSVFTAENCWLSQ